MPCLTAAPGPFRSAAAQRPRTGRPHPNRRSRRSWKRSLLRRQGWPGGIARSGRCGDGGSERGSQRRTYMGFTKCFMPKKSFQKSFFVSYLCPPSGDAASAHCTLIELGPVASAVTDSTVFSSRARRAFSRSGASSFVFSSFSVRLSGLCSENEN